MRKVSFLITGLWLLMFVCSAAISYDFDFSFDHDSPGIICEASFFIDNTHLLITDIKSANSSIILSFINKASFSNRAPPA